MLPQINPYYFQQPMYQNPYQPQNYVQAQPQTINGRLIDNIDSVTANDVSMQGLSVFPKNDLSEVYVKSWQPNGTIQTIRFVKSPVKAVENDDIYKNTNDTFNVSKQGAQEVTDGIMQRLEEIENKIDKILTPVKSRKANDES